jgi:hypothetical protein
MTATDDRSIGPGLGSIGARFGSCVLGCLCFRLAHFLLAWGRFVITFVHFAGAGAAVNYLSPPLSNSHALRTIMPSLPSSSMTLARNDDIIRNATTHTTADEIAEEEAQIELESGLWEQHGRLPFPQVIVMEEEEDGGGSSSFLPPPVSGSDLSAIPIHHPPPQIGCGEWLCLTLCRCITIPTIIILTVVAILSIAIFCIFPGLLLVSLVVSSYYCCGRDPIPPRVLLRALFGADPNDALDDRHGQRNREEIYAALLVRTCQGTEEMIRDEDKDHDDGDDEKDDDYYWTNGGDLPNDDSKNRNNKKKKTNKKKKPPPRKREGSGELRVPLVVDHHHHAGGETTTAQPKSSSCLVFSAPIPTADLILSAKLRDLEDFTAALHRHNDDDDDDDNNSDPLHLNRRNNSTHVMETELSPLPTSTRSLRRSHHLLDAATDGNSLSSFTTTITSADAEPAVSDDKRAVAQPGHDDDDDEVEEASQDAAKVRREEVENPLPPAPAAEESSSELAAPPTPANKSADVELGSEDNQHLVLSMVPSSPPLSSRSHKNKNNPEATANSCAKLSAAATYDDDDNDDYEDLEMASTPLGNDSGRVADAAQTGPTRHQSPTVVVEESTTTMTAGHDKNGTMGSLDCDICLLPYEVGQRVAWSTNAACSHCFHLDCITDWLVKHTSCPNCRAQYI